MDRAPAIVGLTVGDPPELWADLGFTVVDAAAVVGGVRIELTGEGKGVRSWSLGGLAGEVEGGRLDGIPTECVDAPPLPAASIEHPNGILDIDHVVLLSPDLDRTISACTGVGLDLRRERHTDQYGQPARQAFFRPLGGIIEIIGPDQALDGDKPCRFFGLAFTSKDLDATAAFLGDRLHLPKDAVQDGRQIATIDRSVGSSVPMVVMSPHVPADRDYVP